MCVCVREKGEGGRKKGDEGWMRPLNNHGANTQLYHARTLQLHH